MLVLFYDWIICLLLHSRLFLAINFYGIWLFNSCCLVISILCNLLSYILSFNLFYFYLCTIFNYFIWTSFCLCFCIRDCLFFYNYTFITRLYSIAVCIVVIRNDHAYLDCPFLGIFMIIIAIIMFLFSLIILILYLYRVGFIYPAYITAFIFLTILVVCNILVVAGLAFGYYCFCVFFQYITFFSTAWGFFVGICVFIHNNLHIAIISLFKNIFTKH